MANSAADKPNPGVVIIEGHVQGLANTRLLGRAGIPVIVLDIGNCIARRSKYCTAFYRCPDYDSEDFFFFLLHIHECYHLQNWLLLPSNDHAVYTIARHKGQLERFYRLITEDMEVIDKIYNKRKLLSIASAAGLPVPATIMPSEPDPAHNNLRYPVLIKGNNGLTFYKRYHRKAILARDKHALQQALGSLKGIQSDEYFIQELIPEGHKTVSVTLFAINGVVRTFWMGVKLREHPVRFGTATCCQSVHDDELLDMSRKLVSILGYTGVCEIEWLKDPRDNQSKLIEINARTWLWVGLAAKCGINFPVMIWEYVNKGIAPCEINYPDGKIWLNLYTDLFYACKRLFMRIDKPSVIMATYRRFSEACWDWRDPIPFFAYAALLTKFVINR